MCTYRINSQRSSSISFNIDININNYNRKTLLTDVMKHSFEAEGKTCISVSLDDFYLRGEDQDRLAEEYKENPLFRYRGNGEENSL